MASDGRAINLREEEKELDDKLIELGLLEPGMTLQEKRELASVVLESTRMAEEQRNQRKSEEEWESMILEPKASGSNDDTSRSESPELIAISVSKAETSKPSSLGIKNQRRRDDVVPVQNETGVKGRNRMEKEARERKGKRVREEDKRDLIVLELDEEEGEEVLGRREGMDRRRVEPRKENASRVWGFSRRKKEEDLEKDECALERPQKKLSVREEAKETIGKREVEEGKEQMEDMSKGERPMEEKRGRRDVDVQPQDSGQKSSPKVVSSLDEKTVTVPKTAGASFYGPSCSSNVKELNPLRSELHGYSRKRGLPRNPQVSLLQLAKEDVPQRKKSLDEAEIEELVLENETSHEKNNSDQTSIRPSKESKPSPEERDDGDRRLFLEKHMGGRKTVQEAGKSSDGILNGDDWETCPGGSLWIKEAKKRNGVGGGPSGLKEGAFRSLRGNSEQTMSFWGGAGKMKRKEQDVPVEIEEGNGMDGDDDDDDERGGGELNANGRSPLSDFIVDGKKKRRLTKGPSSKKWVDVVIFPDASCTKASDGPAKEATKSSKKILLPPNKRWRRVKRKAKSSFESGSEVDEWISSEEEQLQGKTLTKEQLVARFDKQLDRLKVALKEEEMKNAPLRDKYSRCKLCERKSNFKVPPGFQEPDSDDEWNLWKICFFKPPPESSSEKLKLNPKKEKLKHDATSLTLRSAVTRSQTKHLGDFRSTRSKSPASFEDDAPTSHPDALLETQGKAPLMGIVPNDDISSGEKSPVLGEVVLFEKVIESQPCVTTGTQTMWQDDGNSSASGSQDDSVVSGPKSNGVSKVAQPVWDLLEINSDGEEAVSNSQGRSVSFDEAFQNVTVRRARSESPEYLSSEDIPPSPVSAEHTESVGRASTSFVSKPVAVPSPVISRGLRRGKLRVVEEGKGDHPVKMNVPPRGRKVDARVSKDEEIEEVQEVPEPALEGNDAPEGIPCPICNRVFPMSEIEAHASECDQEEEDPLPQALRDGGRRRQREDMGTSNVAGVSHQQFDVEMRDCEEEMEYGNEYEAACSSQEQAPRPAPLSLYIPISQQKDSLIDYSDQFPHTNSNMNLQATLERMRQSLLKRVRKKTKWRKKKKPKWKGKKF